MFLLLKYHGLMRMIFNYPIFLMFLNFLAALYSPIAKLQYIPN